jgi:hypothetical protein
MSEKLTIAMALRKIKKLKGQIAEHQQRAVAGVSYEVNKAPAFRYDTEYRAMCDLQGELIELEARVAIANANNTVPGSALSLAHAIRTLQETKGRIAFLKGLNLRNETVKDRQTEWDDNEMKQITRVTETTWQSDLSEVDRDVMVKVCQDHFEALNNLVEDANHTVLV